MIFTKFWSCFTETQDPDETNTIKINHVFANRNEEEEIFPLTVKEIVEAQKADPILKHSFKRNAVLDKEIELQLVENESCICNKGRLVIPKPLQRHTTIWYHHYLQHLGHTRLEKTMKAAIYWKGMRTTMRSITKSCKTCQINNKRSLKYGHLPSNSDTHSLGGSMCRPHWSIYPQRQRRLVNRLYGSHHDRPRIQLARSCGITNNHPINDQEGQW